MGCTMVINAIGNILLVPQLGPAGAAWAGLVSFTILLLLGLWFIRRELPSMGWCLALVARGMVVGIFTWLSGVWLRDHAPLIMSLLFTGAVALVLLFATRLLQISDVMQIISWLRRRPVEPPSEIEEETETHV
jgi:peptidoglycan biosynthesis protein MviN/MurJ (putative lipid II flippase)